MAEQHLKVGEPAPDFELTADTGETVRLSDFRGQRVVLYFYPKDDTPGCTKQACSFRDAYPLIEAQNAVVLGISGDDEASHRRFRSKYDLPFTLLVDEGNQVASQYGVMGEKTLFGKKIYGINRSHFVIDEQGELVAVQYKVGAEDSVESALKVLEVDV
jgi:thioredoxin-dependent peroxiredoxin